MCIIVDNNVVARVLLARGDPEYGMLTSCIYHGKPYPARLVYGGRLKLEYFGNHDVRRMILSLDKAGKAYACVDSAVDSEEAMIKASLPCSSDDQHIIALARVSGTRLLATQDKQLIHDFKSKKLIDKPRGKIVRDSSHIRLLRQYCH